MKTAAEQDASLKGVVHGFSSSVLPALAVWTLSVALGFRLYLIISKYSVNLPFWDQWDFYRPLFDKASLWRLFLWQHGPHREGIGLVLDKFLLDFTHWSTRAEALVIGGLVSVAMLLALHLKRKLFGGGIAFSDVLIPLMFLTPAQWECFTVAPNLSYAFPLLLIMLYCLAWLQRDALRKYAGVLSLNFVLIYTGFGFFIGLVTLFLLAVDCYQSARGTTKRPFPGCFLALIIAGASLGSFFIDYTWNPTVDCFHFPYRQPLAYLWFMSLMFANFFGARMDLTLASFLGLAFLLFTVVVLAKHARSLWKERPPSSPNLVITILVTYCLLFSFGAAVGRICLGIGAAQTSRYVTLLIPGLLGAYFHLLTRPRIGNRTTLLVVFFVLLLPGSVQGYRNGLHWYADRKRLWKACYLKNENVEFCDQTTGFKLYWWPQGMHLKTNCSI